MQVEQRAFGRLGNQAALMLAVLVVVLALVAGCAGMPLSTMWKMRKFDVADLARVQPEHIRLAVRIDPAPAIFEPADSRLVLRLTPADENLSDEEYVFELRQADEYSADLLPEPDPDKRWRVSQLNESGLAAWQRLQPRMTVLEDRYSAAEFTISFRLGGDLSRDTRAIIVSSRLELSPEQGPLTLLDRKRTPISFE